MTNPAIPQLLERIDRIQRQQDAASGCSREYEKLDTMLGELFIQLRQAAEGK